MRWLRALRDSIADSWWGVILGRMDTEPSELAGGVLKVAIAVQLLLPLDTFATSTSFATLSVLSENTWGTVLLLLGCLHLAALWSGNRRWRHYACQIGFAIWFAIAVTFWSANPSSLGAVVFLFAGLTQGWCAIRLSGEVR